MFVWECRNVFKRDELGLEILRIAFPAALALAADPIASLIDTAFIGHLGPVEIAAVGVAIAIFNQASKVAIFPLVSITTSFVAQEDTISRITDEQQGHLDLEKATDAKSKPRDAISAEPKSKPHDAISAEPKSKPDDAVLAEAKSKPENSERRHIPSASTALILGVVLGLIQTTFLVLLAKPLLGLMGVKTVS